MKKLISLCLAACMTVTGAVNCFAKASIRDVMYNEKANKFILNWGNRVENPGEMTYDDFLRRYPNTVHNASNMAFTVATDEFKMIKDVPVVKVKTVVETLKGKFKYYSSEKTMKAEFTVKPDSLKEFKIDVKNKKADIVLVYWADARAEFAGKKPSKKDTVSYQLKTKPEIIKGEVYVSAYDLEEIMGRCCAKNLLSSKDKAKELKADKIYTARVIDKILYIPVFSYNTDFIF